MANYGIVGESRFAGRKDLSEVGGWLDSSCTAVEAGYSIADGSRPHICG